MTALFDEKELFPAEENDGSVSFEAPLAERMRPRSLDEYVGQEHILGPGKPLRAMIEAKAGDAPIYVVELLYAGVFGLKNLPAEQQNPFLLIEAPRMLFPFARRIIADVTRDGGYQPLMLDPIDFAQMFQQKIGEEKAASKVKVS